MQEKHTQNDPKIKNTAINNSRSFQKCVRVGKQNTVHIPV